MDAGAAAAAATLRSSRQRSASGTSRSTWPPSATSRPSSAIRCGRRSPARSSRWRFTKATSSRRDSCSSASIARPFEAALAQAEANLIRDQALLAQAEAQLSRDAVERRVSAADGGAAGAAGRARHRLEGPGEQARAAADATAGDGQGRQGDDRERAGAARRAGGGRRRTRSVQLGYTTIRSPIDGQHRQPRGEGRQPRHRQPDRADDDRAASQPVYVTFAVPAIHLATIKRHKAEGVLPVTATPQDGDAAGRRRRARPSSTTPSTRRPTRSS